MSLKNIATVAICSIVLVTVTVAATLMQPRTPLLTATQAIQLLEKDFRENPDAHMAAIDEALNASARLEGAWVEHSLHQLSEKGEQIVQENQKLLDSTHVLLASIRKVREETGCTCKEACSCPLPCCCPIPDGVKESNTLEEQKNSKKRRALNLLFGVFADTEGSCCTGQSCCDDKCAAPTLPLIPDEIAPPTEVIFINGPVPAPLCR